MTSMWKRYSVLSFGVLVLLASAALAQDTPTPTAVATATITPKIVLPTPIANQGAAAITFTAVANRMMFLNTAGTVQLLVRNKTTDACTVTVVSVPEAFLGRTGDVSVTVPTVDSGASGIAVLGPFAPAGFNRKSPAAERGYVIVTTSDCTGADIAVIRHQ